MSKYVTTPGGGECDPVLEALGMDMAGYSFAAKLIRSLWADLLAAKAAADKAIALAVEGLALVDKLQAENACLRVEIADAEAAVGNAVAISDRLYGELCQARRELDRLELVK